ncbi:MAG: hypothetical protein ACOH15_04930 [Acetobacterium sp.]
MSPLCNILNMSVNSILGVTMVEIDRVLTAHIRITKSSCEVFKLLPPPLQNQLDHIASQYPKGGCSVSEAYIGAVASELASYSSANIIHDFNYDCPILHKKEDGFTKI